MKHIVLVLEQEEEEEEENSMSPLVFWHDRFSELPEKSTMNSMF